MSRIFLAFTLWFISTGAAFAYCNDPGSPPRNPSSGEPRKPSCLSAIEHNSEFDCQDHEVRQYRYQLEHYIRDLEEFHMDIQRYVNDALDFTNCEINEKRRVKDRLRQ